MRLAIRSLSFLGYILLGLAVWPWAVWIRVHFTSGHLAHQERLEKFLAAFPSAVSSAGAITILSSIAAAIAIACFIMARPAEIGARVFARVATTCAAVILILNVFQAL